MTVEFGADAPGEGVAAPWSAAVRERVRGLLGREVLRFGLVGVANTGIDLGLYFLLQLGGSPLLIANLISTTAGLSFSFVANRLFTFSARPAGRTGRQLVLFVVCTGIGLWAIQPLVLVGMDRLLADATSLGDLRILLGKLVAIGFGMVWNWSVYSRIVFRATAPDRSA
ncbi:GtrA family protein [uncultured Amnibacterium sp.]|uniref:GtrA family protein n=1 Tax=uncultured Amnibacterium sp. TaxID=1631851 RepID=UPI0035CBF200